MNASKQLPLSFLSPTVLDDYPNGNDQDLRTEQIPDRFKILMVDRISSSSCFLSLHFISKALKSTRPVLFISFNLSYDHWCSLLQKQSIQPTSLPYKNWFKFIDAVNLNLKPFQHLSEFINDQVSQLSKLSISNQSPLVIIDDLTTMIWSDVLSSTHWINCFQSLFPSQCHQNSFSLIIVFHDDLLSSNVRDREIFNYIVNRSDLILTTRALSGQGQGELIVQRGPNNFIDPELPVTLSINQTTQYKIVDTSVTYYPKGLDKGFI